MSSHIFGVFDYVIFGLTLAVSAAIGVYFGCFGSKQKSAKEYLYGDGNMKAIPVGLSLYSSAVSAVSIVGSASEIYLFGTQIVMAGAGAMLSLLITWKLILPVFCGPLNIKTPYEYFELRYDRRVRIVSSFVYILHTLLYSPIILFTCTLPLSVATGIPLPVCTTVIGGICVFYTMVGGFASVIWTDTLQATLMLCSCIFVMVNGVLRIGSLEEIWRRADEGQRIRFFNMNPDPFQRLTFWSAVVGMCFNFASHSGCAASTIQRYMSLADEKQARISTFIGSLGYALIMVTIGLLSICIYAFYSDCDPLKNGDLGSATEILSYYVGDTVGNIPGFSGFFAAGLLSAGLSSISAEINTVAGLIYHDFIQKFSKTDLNETKGAAIMKVIVLVNGIVYLIAAPFLGNMKYLLQFAFIISGLTYGAKLGAMILATTFPKSNSQGVIWGMLSSLLIIGWISIGAFYYDVGAPFILPTSDRNCSRATSMTAFITTTYSPNVTSSNVLDNRMVYDVNTTQIDHEPFIIYKLSFMYYPLLGTVVTILVGLLVSYVTGPNNVNDIDTRLLIPYYRTNKYQSKSIVLNRRVVKDDDE